MTKHNFAVAKIGATRILSLVALQFPKLAFLTTGPLGFLASYLVQKALNWGLNNGIMLINIGLTSFATEKEKKQYEEAIEEAHKLLENKNKLTQEELDAIDNEVIKAFDKFVVFGKLSKPS